MLVLTRRHGESVRIGNDVRVTVVSSTGGQVRIAIQAPDDVGIFREEIFERVATANAEAASAGEAMVSRLGSRGSGHRASAGGQVGE